jgi:urease accessory protein
LNTPNYHSPELPDRQSYDNQTSEATSVRKISLPAYNSSPIPVCQGVGNGKTDHGFLNLNFFRDEKGKTQLNVRAQRWPLRVVRGFAHGPNGLLVHLHNVAGGILGGDQLSTKIELAKKTHGILTTTGAQRIYRAKDPKQISQQTMDVTGGDLSRVEYLPDPTIPYRGSLYRQKNRWNLSSRAALLTWDVMSAGRSGYEPDFMFTEYGNENIVCVEDRPIYWDNQILVPSQNRLRRSLCLERWKHWGTFLFVDASQDEKLWLSLERDFYSFFVSHLRKELISHEMTRKNDDSLDPDVEAEKKLAFGVTLLPRHGLCIKMMATSPSRILQNFYLTREYLIQRVWGYSPEIPRKIH